MKRKRLLCAVLALVLLFSAQPTAAANDAGNKRTTVIEAHARLPVIKVTIPSRSTIYINPLRLPATIGGDQDEVGDQIISTPSCVANESEVPVSVDVTVTGYVKPGSTMTLSPTPTGGVGTDKSAFVYWEIQKADSPDEVEWDSAYDAAKHIIVTDNAPVSKNDVVTLSARTLDGRVAPDGYAPFRLAGDVVQEPTDAWTAKDGINVMVAFTFTPLPYDS